MTRTAKIFKGLIDKIFSEATPRAKKIGVVPNIKDPNIKDPYKKFPDATERSIML